MQNLLLVLTQMKMLVQTAAQKGATIVGVGCIAVFFMILCMDKCSFKKTQKTILLVFFAIFIILFFVLVFFVY